MTFAQNETLNKDSEIKTILALVKQLYEERPDFGSTIIHATYHSGKLQNLKSSLEISYIPAPEYQAS